MECESLVSPQVVQLGTGQDQCEQRFLGEHRADWMDTRPAVGANGGKKAQTQAVLIEEPAADGGHLWPNDFELTPREHVASIGSRMPRVNRLGKTLMPALPSVQSSEPQRLEVLAG